MNMKRKRKHQHRNDGKVDPKTQARDALLREIDASILDPDSKRLITMVATQACPDALANARNALSAAVWRKTEGRKWQGS